MRKAADLQLAGKEKIGTACVAISGGRTWADPRRSER
jgi:hypothetical protein